MNQIVLPQPHEISEREKEDAMGAYLMMFASWGLGFPLPLLNLIASLIYFLINRKTSKFVAFHSLQSLLFHIPISVLNVAPIVWLVVILVTDLSFRAGFFVLLLFALLANILFVVFSLLALMRARKGLFYYLPFFGRVSFGCIYMSGAEAAAKAAPVNLPPEGF